MIHSAKQRFASFCMYVEKHLPYHKVCFSFSKDSFALLSLQWLHKRSNLTCIKGQSSFVVVLQKWIWKKWPHNWSELSSINLTYQGLCYGNNMFVLIKHSACQTHQTYCADDQFSKMICRQGCQHANICHLKNQQSCPLSLKGSKVKFPKSAK